MPTGPWSRSELAGRVERLRALLGRKRLASLLVSHPANVTYLSGFRGEDAVLLVTRNLLYLVSDFRYRQEARETAGGCDFIERKGAETLMARAGDLARRVLGERRGAFVRRLGFEPTSLTVADRSLLAAAVRKRGGGRVPLVRAGRLVERLRERKSPAEVAAIRRAISVAERAFAGAVRTIRATTSEADLAAEIEYRMRRLGAEAAAFPTIAAFGARAALPHARPSAARRRRPGEAILLDWGARVEGYHCDLTRTFGIGTLNPFVKRVHEVVRQAQAAAIAAVRPGALRAEVDRAAREVIARAGRGPAFGHGIGHGVGLEVHEAPGLAPSRRGRLEPGMVVTIEPGVYLPGRLGVRIEDDVRVTESGAEVLSSLPRGLEPAVRR